MKRIGLILVLTCMSVLTTMGQSININGIEYDYNVNYKFINGKKVIISESASVKSASTSLSGSVTIPSQITYKGKSIAVTSISSYAFQDCSQITSIVVPSGVGSIGSYAFKDCTGLTSIKLPLKMKAIGASAFENCISLLFVELPQIKNDWGGVEWLSGDMFYGCSSLVYVKIPSTIQGMEGGVFHGCTSLTDVFCFSTKNPFHKYSFEGLDLGKIRIHVTNAAISQYRNSNWSQFKSIDTNMTRPQVKRQANKQSTELDKNEIKAIDMGGSVEWANMNLGATTPQDPGGVFAWGETTSRTGDFNLRNYTAPKLTELGGTLYDGVTGSKYDAARCQWGHGWRMPTEKEFRELYNKCRKIVNEKGKYVEFVASNGNRLILPVLLSADITRNGIGNFYWTSNNSFNGAYCCQYDSWLVNYFKIANREGCYGGLIRPVRDKR